MAMTAHGFGIAEIPSPHLIYSNVIWGAAAYSFPTVFNTLGYSSVMLLAIFVSAWMIAAGMWMSVRSVMIAVGVTALVFARPLMIPQFTMTAGLAMVSAVVMLRLAATSGRLWHLVVACGLAYLAFLVRDQMFYLLLAITLPLLPYRAFKSASFQIAFAVLIVAIGVSTFLDTLAYQGEEWAFFHEFQSVRVPFSDYGATGALLAKPHLLIRHGYSTNEIMLLGSWFFVDPEISRPDRLRALLEDLGPLVLQPHTINNAWRAIEGFLHPSVLPMVVVAGILFALNPSWRGLAVWLLAISALVAIGMMGRPAVPRIYYPIVALLLVTPLLLPRRELQPFGSARPAVVIILAVIWNGWMVSDELLRRSRYSEGIQKYVETLPERTIVSWGSGFPYENAVPVLGGADRSSRISLFSMGSTTFAPNTISRQHTLQGRGFPVELNSTEGVRMIANDDYMKLLETYCSERGRLIQIEDANAADPIRIRAVRCVLRESS